MTGWDIFIYIFIGVTILIIIILAVLGNIGTGVNVNDPLSSFPASERSDIQKLLDFQNFGQFQTVNPDPSEPDFDKFSFQLYNIGGTTDANGNFTPNLVSLDDPSILDNMVGLKPTGCAFPDQIIAKKQRQKCVSQDGCFGGVAFGQTRDFYIQSQSQACDPKNIYGPIVNGDTLDTIRCLVPKFDPSVPDNQTIIGATGCDIGDVNQLWSFVRFNLDKTLNPSGPLALIQTRNGFGTTGGCLVPLPSEEQNGKPTPGISLGLGSCTNEIGWFINDPLTVNVKIPPPDNAPPNENITDFVALRVPAQMSYIPPGTTITSLPKVDPSDPNAGSTIQNFLNTNYIFSLTNIGQDVINLNHFFIPDLPGTQGSTNLDTPANRQAHTFRPYDYRLYNFIRENPGRFPF